MPAGLSPWCLEAAERFDDAPVDLTGAVPGVAGGTVVEVVARDCLDCVFEIEGDFVLVVMAREGLELCQNDGSSLDVFRGSSLCASVEAVAGAGPVFFPKRGGFYCGRVLVRRISDPLAGEVECPMVLMRTVWSSADAVVVEPCEDVEARIRHVLGRCRFEGHSRLLFAWGSLEHTALEEVAAVGRLLRDALVVGDVVECFSKCVFACGRLDDARLGVLREQLLSR